MRFPKSFREQRRDAKAGNDHYADLAGKPRLDYGDSVRPVQHRTQQPTERISEADVNNAIRSFAGSRDDVVLYRNNRGVVDLPSGGKLRYGVGPNGAGDFIGYRRIVISPQMVGTVLAQFVSVEAKAPTAGPVPEHQLAFLRAVNAAGGFAIVVRDKADLEKL